MSTLGAPSEQPFFMAAALFLRELLAGSLDETIRTLLRKKFTGCLEEEQEQQPLSPNVSMIFVLLLVCDMSGFTLKKSVLKTLFNAQTLWYPFTAANFEMVSERVRAPSLAAFVHTFYSLLHLRLLCDSPESIESLPPAISRSEINQVIAGEKTNCLEHCYNLAQQAFSLQPSCPMVSTLLASISTRVASHYFRKMCFLVDEKGSRQNLSKGVESEQLKADPLLLLNLFTTSCVVECSEKTKRLSSRQAKKNWRNFLSRSYNSLSIEALQREEQEESRAQPEGEQREHGKEAKEVVNDTSLGAGIDLESVKVPKLTRKQKRLLQKMNSYCSNAISIFDTSFSMIQLLFSLQMDQIFSGPVLRQWYLALSYQTIWLFLVGKFLAG